MSVIIRLQNLPWSANALDIRQFFRGLSIPEGGVHIVGGEMGDAFIAFSTDEDARQAMMHDREAINGVQIRLLLSSRAEMQKVIETARQQSLLALKKASGVALAQPKASPPAVVATNIQKTVVAPQPPIITASSFQNILSTSAAAITPSFLAYQQQAGFNLIAESNSTTAASSTKNNNDSDDSDSRHSRERHRSFSRERRRSRSRSKERGMFRRRRERSRDRSRERDWTSGKRSSRRRSRSREKNRPRSRDRSHERERSRNKNRDSDRRNSREGSISTRNRGSDSDMKTKSNMSSWGSTNSYKAGYSTGETGQNSLGKLSSSLASINKPVGLTSPSVAGVTVATSFQNYNIANQSLTTLNNYSLSGIIGTSSSDSFKGFALQNPYTTVQNDSTSTSKENETKTTSSSAIPGIFVEKKIDETENKEATIESGTSLPQEPIAFANVNPYEQMYPTLFAQAAALNSGQKSGISKQSSVSMPTNSPKTDDSGPKIVDPNATNSVKISNMCSRTNYSDLRKFFIGLFIPHNGIKLLNDKHGLRVGIAYVQFSRQSSVSKALCRNNNLLRGRSVIIEAVSEQEFIEAEDSFRPANQDRNNDSDNENGENNTQSSNTGFSPLNPYKKIIQLEPFSVLYIEDIPALATEQDIIKMFSSYSLYDILLIASPENRREFVAHVRFSREEDAKLAYEDRAHHQIGYRRVRIRPGSLEEMENAKEKIRLANEQLLKEEQAAEEEEAKRKEETKRKLEKLITEHITQEEMKEQSVVSMDLTNDDADNEPNENDVVETDKKANDGDMDVAIAGNIYDGRDMRENLDNDDLQKMNIFSMQNQLNNKINVNLDPRRPQTPNIPSIFDLDPMNSLRNQSRSNLFNDPRLRNMSDKITTSTLNVLDSKMSNPNVLGSSNYSNLNSNPNNAKDIIPPSITNNTEKNFVILKNCDYNTRINDVAQLLLTANLALKHIEPLHNERLLSTGEFIVEFRRSSDAEIAVKRFHNVQFRNRSLRGFPITPQEIADRLGKPFLSYIPGGNGIRMTKSMAIDRLTRNDMSLSTNLLSNMRFGKNSQQSMNIDNMPRNNPFSDNNGKNVTPIMNNSNTKNILNNSGGNGIPDKFNNPGCVLSMENVPYKAQISDILRFFQGFDLMPDDIIRRFNDDGSPTGDARVAFNSPEEARAAFESRRRKQMYGRNIFIRVI